MQAPTTVEMTKRGETPFDMEAVAKEAVQGVMSEKTKAVGGEDMLEMEPFYVNDLVTCDPHTLFCEMNPEQACLVNPMYDASKFLNGKYWSEGCHLEAPSQEGMHSANQQDASGARRDQSTTPVEDLRPICGYGCSISSLFCSFPSCLGCQGKGKVLFLMGTFSCLKCLRNPGADEDKRCCALVEQQSYLVVPQTCCECQYQFCCTDNRCAFPCTKTVPCIVNACGLNLCADWKCNTGCCKSIGDLIPRLKPENA